jgi:hypothetical protein
MIKVISEFDAVVSLVGGDLSRPLDGIIRYHSGQTPPSDSAIDAEVIKLQAAYDALEYARNRQAEYPDWGTQLNKIYDDGLTKWKSEMVDPVKTKWPKNNTGPVE